MLGSIVRRSSVLIAAAALSCDTPTVPIADVYELRSIANVALPAPYAPNLNYPNRMISGMLILYEDGTGHWETEAEVEVGGGTFHSDVGLEWTRAGNDLSITFECNDTASCIAGPHFAGVLDGSRLTVPTSTVMRAPIVFDALR